MRILQVALVSGLLGLGSGPLLAEQEWGISVEMGLASFSGHSQSIDGTTPEASGHPSPAHLGGLQLDRTSRTIRFSLGLRMLSTGVEFENDDAAAQLKNLLDLIEVSPRVSFTIFHPREAEVWLHLGAVIDRWDPDGDDSRTTLGGVGGISLELPLSSRFKVQVGWDGMLTSSVFDEDDLPAEFERKGGIGQRWLLGARYRI